MTIEDETTTKRQPWVVEWAKSESFWKDVASRAVAGTIVIALGAFVAAALGLIQGRIIIYLFVVLLWVGLVSWFGQRGIRRISEWANKFTTKKRDAIQIINFFVGSAILFLLAWGGIALFAVLIPVK